MTVGVPYFALSDANRASEMRADADAVFAAAAAHDAVLLPLTGGKVPEIGIWGLGFKVHGLGLGV